MGGLYWCRRRSTGQTSGLLTRQDWREKVRYPTLKGAVEMKCTSKFVKTIRIKSLTVAALVIASGTLLSAAVIAEEANPLLESNSGVIALTTDQMKDVQGTGFYADYYGGYALYYSSLAGYYGNLARY